MTKKSASYSRSVTQGSSKSLGFTHSERISDMDRDSKTRIERQLSGERPWWLDPNSDNVPEGVERYSGYNDDISQETTISTNLPDDGKYTTNEYLVQKN